LPREAIAGAAPPPAQKTPGSAYGEPQRQSRRVRNARAVREPRDAVVVFAQRPVRSGLRVAMKIARETGRPLIPFCTGRASPEDAARVMAERGIAGTVIPFAADYAHPLITEHRTDTFAAAVTGREDDYFNAQRNAALVMMHRAGFEKVLFMTDNVLVVNVAELTTRASNLGVALAVADDSYPCRAAYSVFDRIWFSHGFGDDTDRPDHRMTRGDDALVADVREAAPDFFFPNLGRSHGYRLMKTGREQPDRRSFHGRVQMVPNAVALNGIERARDSWPAAEHEFSAVLHEMSMGLVSRKIAEGGRAKTWESVITRRLAKISEAAERLVELPGRLFENCAVMESLAMRDRGVREAENALARLSTLRPPDFETYLDLLRGDAAAHREAMTGSETGLPIVDAARSLGLDVLMPLNV
jgi:hypothetical protein